MRVLDSADTCLEVHNLSSRSYGQYLLVMGDCGRKIHAQAPIQYREGKASGHRERDLRSMCTFANLFARG